MPALYVSRSIAQNRVSWLDVQQTAAVQAAKFMRRLGVLDAQQLRLVEHALAEVLGLKLANSGRTETS